MNPRTLLDRLSEAHRSTEDPLALLRLVAGGLVLAATLFALLLGLTGAEPRAFQLALLLWAFYGFVLAVIGGVLSPLVDVAARALGDVGLVRQGGGFSAIETLVARGDYAAAADAYAERAYGGGTRADDPRRVEAALRRAALLAGPLGAAPLAATELEALREKHGSLAAEDDLRIGAALADLYERRLGDPGRAMAELRRLIDLHPGARQSRRLRVTLDELKRTRFGDSLR